jgi:hypothetical protein
MGSNEQFKYNHHNDAYLYSLNRNVFANETASSIFTKQYKEKLNKDNSFYIVMGSDSGLLIDHIIQHQDVSDTRYLFIELENYIDAIKNKSNFGQWPENIKIATIDTWQAVAKSFLIDLYIYKNGVVFLKSIAAIDAYLPAYAEAILRFEKEYQKLQFLTRTSLAVSPFMSSQLANICENNFPIAKLKNTFNGKSAIILAGGPSLDENLTWVKNNKDSLVIIAVSRIAKRLMQEKLIPHIIVSVDPHEISFDVSKELLKLPTEVLFIHSNNVTPLLLGQWQGKSAYMGPRFPWPVKNDIENISTGGPTVTNAALKAAVYMGFENILLSGVDLCFSDKGVSHASGSNESKIGPTLGQTGAWVDTYSGKKVETFIVFEHAAKSIAYQADDALKRGITIYNLSENAARIDAIDHIPCTAISFENEDNNFTANIAALCPNKNITEVRADQNKVLSEVSSKLLSVKKVLSLAQEALECNEKLFKEKGKEEANFKFKLRMDKIEDTLCNRYKNTSTFIKNYGMDKFILSAQTDSSEEWSNDKLEDTGRLYYQAYIDSCKALIELLTKTFNRVLSRQQEHKTNPQFPSLFEQWKNDNNLGRAKVWQSSHLHANTEVPVQYISQFRKFYEEFTDIIANENTAHLTRTIKEASLDGVRRKIITLFQQGNIDALNVLSQSLELQKKNSNKAETLYNLSLAFLNCATENYDSSLAYFESLPNNAIFEDELQQIMLIAFKLSNYSLASACLDKLNNITDIYMAKHAKLLKLLGQTDKAVKLYTGYLASFNEDTKAWLELGELYFDMKAYDSALMAFEVVLSQDNKNSLAFSYKNKLNNILI